MSALNSQSQRCVGRSNAARLGSIFANLGLCALILASASSAVAGDPPVVSAVIRHNDIFAPGVRVREIYEPRVNQLNGWGFGGFAGDEISFFFGSTTGGAGAFMRSESVIGPYTQSAIAEEWGLSDDGKICYEATYSENGGPNTHGVWVEDGLIVRSGDMSPEGEYYKLFEEVGITGDGKVHFIGVLSSTPGGATTNRGLFLAQDQPTLLLGGDSLLNLPSALAMPSPFDKSAFSANGNNYIGRGFMDELPWVDEVIIVSGAGLLVSDLLVREDYSLPEQAGGLPNERWIDFKYMGVAESGDYFIAGDSTGIGTDSNQWLFRSGQVLYRKGQILDGVELSTNVSGAAMNEDTDVAFIWGVRTPAISRALFFNDQMLIKIGDEVDWDNDGVTDPGYTLNFFGNVIAISNRQPGGWVDIYFTGDVQIPQRVAVAGLHVRVPIDVVTCPADLAGGSPSGPDGFVDVNDLFALLSAWNTAGAGADLAPPNNIIDVSDLFVLLGTWGPCN